MNRVAPFPPYATSTHMTFRALSLVGFVALGLAAAACSAESEDAVGADVGEIRARPNPAAGLSTADLKSELAKAVDGLDYMSEADYPFDVFVAPGTVGAPIDAAAVKAAFNDVVGTKDSINGTALQDMIGSEELSFEEWMSNDTSDVDQSDPDAVKYA